MSDHEGWSWSEWLTVGRMTCRGENGLVCTVRPSPAVLYFLTGDKNTWPSPSSYKINLAIREITPSFIIDALSSVSYWERYVPNKLICFGSIALNSRLNYWERSRNVICWVGASGSTWVLFKWHSTIEKESKVPIADTINWSGWRLRTLSIWKLFRSQCAHYSLTLYTTRGSAVICNVLSDL